ncbi:winged helix-turn-helix transcriptional regulator [Allonocardiopsis opalescens]|uniref:HxlR family transcriptional regulator n=1 Tax=Allonocardiopsis opalescens TaxID=1144618 RepID=A0A2T0Q5D0_9ACTN|nr:helix-turn-helix domain-containing protein [Allonocardiopsis opalescens]PRX99035.1 HxlR family transcriptional regulator [Allonocardiopsis opalescens]
MCAADTGVPLAVSAPLAVPVRRAEHEACPVADVLRRVGDRWSVLVVVLLGRRPYRFNELHRAVEGISQRMLTRTLRGLEADGLVRRTVFPTVPPAVEYELTELGGTLLGPLSAVAEWAMAHRGEIEAARAAAAQAAEPPSSSAPASGLK